MNSEDFKNMVKRLVLLGKQVNLLEKPYVIYWKRYCKPLVDL